MNAFPSHKMPIMVNVKPADLIYNHLKNSNTFKALTSNDYWEISILFFSSADFFPEPTFCLKKFFQEYHQSVKMFGSR